MSEWIKLPRVVFSRHGGMLTLNESVARVWGLICEEDDPVQIEAWVRTLIAVHRPEMKDCIIDYLGFSAWNRRWEIGVEHASMPVWEDGAYRPEMPLIPPVDAAVVIGGAE